MPGNQPEATWRNSDTKEMLREAILRGDLHEESDLHQLYTSNALYYKWPWAQFKRNTSSLITSIKSGKQGIKWKGSKGRALLKEQIIAGIVHEMSDPEQVHAGRDEFKIFPINSFKTNMGNLLDQIITQFERLEVDTEAYGHDMAIILERRKNNPLEKRPWHRSPCPSLLEKDVKDGKHLEIDPETGKKVKPVVLYQSRLEYREFSQKVFRNHLYQEVDKRAKQQLRMDKKKTRVPMADRYQVSGDKRHLLDRVD
ncbi:hypothetical protein SEMRO_45_G027240.1 [Seminavis robusta]|uniref:Uncharacterized protein n=1 Tax=Seminavis robusta TaxID=568900 RepID=A0A9N8H1P9_9STRA|nr:hypothetical protein SEMRO_45_G027240.1 [Seminavis robusta]|eukprot:Sro45_g027240.1 n/a (255) ;mRNA; f:153276-154040